jgi:hypothetical protein
MHSQSVAYTSCLICYTLEFITVLHVFGETYSTGEKNSAPFSFIRHPSLILHIKLAVAVDGMQSQYQVCFHRTLLPEHNH